jgi:hypothetical protein
LASRTTALLVGLSHVTAIRLAQEKRKLYGSVTVNLRTMELWPKYNPPYSFVDGQETLHRDIEPDLRRTVVEVEPDCIFAAFWGNQHFSCSTANFPRRLDFILPSEPDLSLDPHAEIVPFDVAREYTRQHCNHIELLITMTQRVATVPLYLVPAPPPIADFSAIPSGSSDRSIDALVAAHGIAPEQLRYKYWRLVDLVHREIAARRKVEPLIPPRGTVDVNGFRQTEYYGNDWIHANEEYGELVIKQFEVLIAKGQLRNET